ncbi:MAG: NAD-dependent epimerase/dehydratase family protein [Phycisphaerae bacterium]|nr:NAD-dependent epimerase/dehydratase family protein [Phycisphaerae bacterium]
MKAFVTGGAGLVGSVIVDRLMAEGHSTTIYDNLSLGQKAFLESHLDDNRCRFLQEDLLDTETLDKAMAGHDIIFHMAANSDIMQGVRDTAHDLRQGTLATFNTLDAMRKNDIKKIVFASSSVVYGESKQMPTEEDYGPLLPISFYGASKLACEGLTSAFCHNFQMQAWVYRFGNIVGENGTHGVILDFIRKLQKDPTALKILGDGKQAKPYLHVDDCVDGMLYGLAHADDEVNYFNLAVLDALDVASIAEIVVKAMGLSGVTFSYTGGKRGWKGDVPQVRLSPEKMAKLGWKARLTSRQAVEFAVKQLVERLCT